MTLDEGYGTHQTSFKIRKSLRELVHKPRNHKSRRPLFDLPALPAHDYNTEEYAYDVLYECQRGSLAVGYSSKTLLQFDPNPWCDADMRFTPMDIENYQLPDPTWEWVSKEWMIDMTGDVDEAGWQYALKFHGAVWHGNYKHFRSFVRRRRWLRLRRRQTLVKKEVTNGTTSSSSLSSSSSSSAQHTLLTEIEAIKNLKKCRLDRERLSVLDSLMKSTLLGLQDQLLEKAPEFMTFFDYDESKYKFLHQILSKKFNSNTRSFDLTSAEKKAIQSLSFYYDIQRILNTIDPSHH